MATKRINIILILFLSTLFLSCSKKNTEPVELIWVYQFKQPAEALSLGKARPTIIGDQVIISPDGIISTIELSNGSLFWEYKLNEGGYSSAEILLRDENSIFIKDEKNNEIYRLNILTGELKWNLDAPINKEYQQFSNDGIDEIQLYLIGSKGEIFVYSKNGEFIKEIDVTNFGLETSARSIHILKNQLIFSQRFLGDECPTNRCGRILSIHKETEDLLWEYRTDNGGFIFEPILLEDEIIYAGVTDGSGEFVALNANNGEVIWKTLGVIGQSYTLTDSMVLVNGGVRLYALDKFTGKELWNTGLEFGGGHGQDNIGYLNGYVYHAHSGRLYIIEGNSGEIVHVEERSPDGSQFYLLTAGEDRIYMQTNVALHAYTPWE
jgi:outer membrane protein assembly factor BamB